MTGTGGKNAYGAIFCMDTNGSNYRELYSFNVTNYGATGTLTIAGNKMYGETYTGFPTVTSTIFSIDTSGADFKTMFVFNGTDGSGPCGYLTLLHNKLYGMTSGGGAHNYGVVFSIDTNGSAFKDMYDCSPTDLSAFPCGALTLVGSRFYAMVSGDDAYNSGNMFSIDTTGAHYKFLYSFSGWTGTGSLVYLGGDRLCGMTWNGGTHGDGMIFSIDTNGTAFKDMFDFNGANGQYPAGTMALYGNKLYGTTTYGGTNDSGVVFSVDTGGAGFLVMHSFAGPDGRRPFSKPILAGNNVYASTPEGGSDQYGNIFSVDTNGSNFNVVISYQGTKGIKPYGTLTQVGGKFYGMTEQGGPNNDGVIFSVDTNGDNYKDLHDFTGTDGESPTTCKLLNIAGKLFGVTPNGGGSGWGCVFSLDTTGANYKVLINFGITNGETPSGSLTSSGGKLFGTTESGGTNGWGTVFSVDTSGNNYKQLYSFYSSSGCTPTSGLVLSGSKLFGILASQTSSDGNGEVFSVDTTGKNMKYLLWNLGYNSFPSASLILSGKMLYGMDPGDGTYSNGYVFSVDTAGTVYNTLHNFSITDGSFPYGGLTLIGARVYGMTEKGGLYSDGTIFSVDTNGSNFSSLYNFNDTTGINPWGDLTRVGGDLYGMTSTDGAYLDGTIFGSVIPLSVIANTSANVKCNGGKTGSVWAIASFGKTPYNYVWMPGGATGDTVTGLSAGTYTVTVTDNIGAVTTATVAVSQPTAILLTHDSLPALAGCNGMAAITASGGSSPYAYLWATGQTTDSIQNQCPGNYCITVTDSIGCVQSTCVNVNCLNNYYEDICMVSIDTTNNKSEVIWGRVNSPPAGSTGNYNIYKYNGSAYVLIHSQPLDSMSEFVDTASNPAIATQSYEISTVDSCGESTLSPAHTSILLTTSAGTNAYLLNWTPYIGFTPVRYRIYRGPSMSTLVQIDSVANTIYNYVDSFPPANSYYVVEAVNPTSACVPSTHSFQKHTPFLSGSFSNGFNTIVLGVNNLANGISNINLYPNPASETLNLTSSVSGAPLNAVIKLTDITNHVLLTINTTLSNGKNIPVDVSKLSQGVYFIQIITNKSVQTEKFVKE